MKSSSATTGKCFGRIRTLETGSSARWHGKIEQSKPSGAALLGERSVRISRSYTRWTLHKQCCLLNKHGHVIKLARIINRFFSKCFPEVCWGYNYFSSPHIYWWRNCLNCLVVCSEPTGLQKLWREDQQAGVYQVGSDWIESAGKGKSQRLLCKQHSAWPPPRAPTSLDSPWGPTPRRRGKTPKDKTHHSPPKQTSRATQNFSIRAPRGGQEMDECSPPPPPPLVFTFTSLPIANVTEVSVNGTWRALTAAF